MSEMTLKRAQELAEHDGHFYNLDVTTGMFSTPVPVRCDEITDKHVTIINAMMEWDAMTLNAIKTVLLLDYFNQCSVTDWGLGRGRDNPFKIHTPDDAYAQSRLHRVLIDRPERYNGPWSIVGFNTEWESEHGVHVAVRGGWVWGIAFDYNIPMMDDSV
jgi:hypothetical protein